MMVVSGLPPLFLSPETICQWEMIAYTELFAIGKKLLTYTVRLRRKLPNHLITPLQTALSLALSGGGSQIPNSQIGRTTSKKMV